MLPLTALFTFFARVQTSITNDALPSMEYKDETSSDRNVVKPVRTHRTSLPGRPILKTSKVYWRDYDYKAYRNHKNESTTTVMPYPVQNDANPRTSSGLKRSFSKFDDETSEEREVEAILSGQQMATTERPSKRRRFNPSPTPCPSASPVNFNKTVMDNTKVNTHCDHAEDPTASQTLYGVALPYTRGRVSKNRIHKAIVKFAVDMLDVNREESTSNINSLVYANFWEIPHKLRNWHQSRSAANGRLGREVQKWTADIIDAAHTPEEIEAATSRIDEVDNDICDSPLYALASQEADQAMASKEVAERLYWMDSVISRLSWMTTERELDPEDFWRESAQTHRYEEWSWKPSPEVELQVPSIVVSPPSVEQSYDFSQPQTPIQDSQFGHQLTVSYCLNTYNVLPGGIQKGLALEVYCERLSFTVVPPFREQARRNIFAKIHVPIGENSTGCRASSGCTECFPRESHPWPSFDDPTIWVALRSWVDSLPTLLPSNSQRTQPVQPGPDAQTSEDKEVDELAFMFQRLNLGRSEPVEVSQGQTDAPKPRAESAPITVEPPQLANIDPPIDTHPTVEEPTPAGLPDADRLPTVQQNGEGTNTPERPRTASRKRSAPRTTSDDGNEAPSKVRRVTTRAQAALEAVEHAAAVAAATAKKSRRKQKQTTDTQRKTWNLRPRRKWSME